MFKRTVNAYETAILWQHGKIFKQLEPGRYGIAPFQGYKLTRYDLRAVALRINGQEVMLADRTSLKINVAGTYHLTDPVKRVMNVSDDQLADYINQAVQLALRTLVTPLTLDELLEQKSSLSEKLLGLVGERLEAIGLKLSEISIKDVILPADLRAAYVEAAAASTRSKAQLEYARGQTAALRNLANSASLIEQHPELIQLMSIQKADKQAGSSINLHFGKNEK